MRTFFHGWKRKTGCVTLLMALAVAGLWIRTAVMVDSVSVRVADHSFAVWSCHDGYLLATWDRQPASLRGPDQQGLFNWSWYSSKLYQMSPRYGDGSVSNILSWVKPDQSTMWDLAIHDQWLVLFLSMLSAFLIFWTPRTVSDDLTHPFFHGWRRKAGCVTLLIACVLMAGWVRSFSVMDVLAFPRPLRQHIVDSVNGKIWWTAYLFDEPAWEFDSLVDHRIYSPAALDAMLQRSMFAEIEDVQFVQWVIPYWAITLPPTLLSAYLLLWKPRKKA